MTLEIQNSLKNVINTFESKWDSKDPKKGIKRVLDGLKDQVTGLENATKNFFSKLDTNMQMNWDISLENVKKEMVAIERWAFFSINEEKDLLKDLVLLCTNCDQNTIVIQELYETQKLETLETIYEKFIFNKHKTSTLFEKTIKKLQKLQTKVALHDSILKNCHDNDSTSQLLNNVMLRIKKTVPNEVISNELKNSFTKDNQRTEKYNSLKNKLLESLVKYNTLEDLIQRSILTLKALPKIANFCEELQPQKNYFKTLKNHLKLIDTHSLALGFVEKYQQESITPNNLTRENNFYKRDLTDFHIARENYKKSLNNFDDADKALANLIQSMNTHFPLINESLKEIFQAIESIETREDDTLDFIDDVIGKTLKTQKQKSIDQLKLLQNEIQKKWNGFYLALDEVKNQRNNFITFNYIIDKMSNCYLQAEYIQAEIRNLRKTENYRVTHEAVLKNNITFFHKLCSLILKNNKSISGSNIKSMNIENNFPNFFMELHLQSATNSNNKNSSSYSDLTLQDEYHRVMKKIDEIKLGLLVDRSVEMNCLANTINLVWTSEDSKKEAVAAYCEQKLKFENELNRYKEQIQQAFTKTLPEICRIMTNEINREVETLATTMDPYYDDRFTEAYFAESSTHKAVQVLGGYVTSAFVYGGSLALNALNQKLGYIQDGKQEEFKMPMEPIHFDKVTSPFDQMQQFI